MTIRNSRSATAVRNSARLMCLFINVLVSLADEFLSAGASHATSGPLNLLFFVTCGPDCVHTRLRFPFLFFISSLTGGPTQRHTTASQWKRRKEKVTHTVCGFAAILWLALQIQRNGQLREFDTVCVGNVQSLVSGPT